MALVVAFQLNNGDLIGQSEHKYSLLYSSSAVGAYSVAGLPFYQSLCLKSGLHSTAKVDKAPIPKVKGNLRTFGDGDFTFTFGIQRPKKSLDNRRKVVGLMMLTGNMPPAQYISRGL